MQIEKQQFAHDYQNIEWQELGEISFQVYDDKTNIWGKAQKGLLNLKYLHDKDQVTDDQIFIVIKQQVPLKKLNNQNQESINDKNRNKIDTIQQFNLKRTIIENNNNDHLIIKIKETDDQINLDSSSDEIEFFTYKIKFDGDQALKKTKNAHKIFKKSQSKFKRAIKEKQQLQKKYQVLIDKQREIKAKEQIADSIVEEGNQTANGYFIFYNLPKIFFLEFEKEEEKVQKIQKMKGRNQLTRSHNIMNKKQPKQDDDNDEYQIKKKIKTNNQAEQDEIDSQSIQILIYVEEQQEKPKKLIQQQQQSLNQDQKQSQLQKMEKKDINLQQQEDTQCAICYYDIYKIKSTIQLCKHSFCADCLIDWGNYEEEFTCPKDRSKINNIILENQKDQSLKKLKIDIKEMEVPQQCQCRLPITDKCKACKMKLCDNCSKCQNCKMNCCPECDFQCESCSKIFCQDEECAFMCIICDAQICRQCCLKKKCDICQEVDGLICYECFEQCSMCSKQVCLNDFKNCRLCESALCLDCSIEMCNEANFCFICDDDSICRICFEGIWNNIPENAKKQDEECAFMCIICDAQICRQCCSKKKCDICQEVDGLTCDECSDQCSMCSKQVCLNHFEKCRLCESAVCFDCSMQMCYEANFCFICDGDDDSICRICFEGIWNNIPENAKKQQQMIACSDCKNSEFCKQCSFCFSCDSKKQIN